METRALAGRRAWYAAGLLAVLVAALLVAWFVSGWAEVRARQRDALAAPAAAADRRAGDLARELRGQLEALIAHEAQRPYFHYQNLMHDPGGSVGWSVSPSPLAQGSDDPLVLGYFQIDARGRVTTPTINDDLPDRSDAKHLAERLAFRDEVTRSLAAALTPAHATLVAQAGRQIEIDPSTYAQNAAPNVVYQAQVDNNGNWANPAQAAGGGVTITVSALEWRTMAFAGVPALVAVRGVRTPDGALEQGFVIDRATLTSWLAQHAGDMVAQLAPGDRGAEVAPGWQLAVAPNPRALAAASLDSAGIARGFIIRFVIVGLVAAAAALLVVMLVARAEQLARERSQFAAAAAHELRTPLAGLQLYGDMVADGLGDPGKLRDYAKRMSEEASRLGRVVSNVLGFSQLERGNLSVDAQPGALADALRELAERAEPALDRAGAALELDVPPELRARFDRDALARVIGNLLDNAEKYARGSADRTITLAAREAGDAVEVTVADHGPGVAAKTRLFEAFARGVTADGPAGLGLGLALSRSLARAMGGELDHRSADGDGAQFVLRLPRA